MPFAIPLTVIIWSILCLIWGTTWLVIKIGLADLPPIGFAATRFLLAAAILFVALRVQKIPLPRSSKEWRLLAITGLLQFALNYSLIFWGEQHITSGLAAVLQAMISVFGLLLAWIFLPSERITPVKVLAVCVGVVGVAVIFGDQLRVQNALAMIASVGMLVSAYAASQAAVLVKARGAAMHPAVLSFGQMVCGLPPLIAYSLIVEGNPLHYHWTTRAALSVLYLALVGTVAAFWLYYWLLGKVESTKAMMISVVTPLIAVVVGWAALGEQLPSQTLFGGAMILASIALLALRRGV